MSKKINTDSDFQGVTRIATDAVIGLTDVIEGMHQRVIQPPFLPSTSVQKLISKAIGITYKNIKWGTRFIGGGLDKGLGQLAPFLKKGKTTNEKEAIRAALNGVIGDYLEENDNPLQILMQFRYQKRVVKMTRKSINKTYPNITGKILLMVHGACMNDIQWTRKQHNHGDLLSTDTDFTTIYLHYNSGRPISSNGKNLNEKLEELVNNWPIPIEELVIIGHSMGGLVTRSALHYGKQDDKLWTSHLKKVIFLGTPHHGSAVERTGNYLDLILENIPYTKPLARLGKIRSAGVTDLRFGNLIDEDWQGINRFEKQTDQRQPVPLPKSIAFYSIAAVIGKSTNRISKKLGDGLVDVNSALGKHKNPDKNLNFKKKNTWIAFEHNHTDLLSSTEVYLKIKEWLR